MLLILEIALAVAYSVVAHLASARHDAPLAVAALALLLLMLLAAPLLQRRWWAWAGLAGGLAALVWLARSPYAQVPILLVPTAFIALVAYWFGRSIAPGRTPLITKIVSAMEDGPPPAELLRYTRALTAAWAIALGVLALLNLGLALIAVPDGLLARFGLHAPVTVTESQWSWFANVFNYGIIGGFFAVEFAVRKRRFPGRYHSFADFVRRLRGLGPAFWRDFLR